MDLINGSIEEALTEMEREMKAMWDTGKILNELQNDRELVRMIMSALFYERLRFQSEIDVIIGEA
jgi:hypothetical protein